MSLTQQDVLKYGVKLIVIFMAIPFHEFAHAWAADKLGDDTPSYQHRLTLNPLAHIDPVGAICIFFTGFGWGRPVQVNALNFKKSRKGMAITAAAGPIANVILGIFGMIIYKFMLAAYISNPDNEGLMWGYLIFQYFTLINVGLAAFNLIPIPPLDGSKILSYFTPPKVDKFMAENQLYISLGFLLLLISGALDKPLGWVQDGMFWLIDKFTFWVDPIAKSLIG
ncbi:MAG: site-2 protease family protein [Ruminococcus sp.]|nr:site-2 protease family protein [Ruminococcus sp.]